MVSLTIIQHCRFHSSLSCLSIIPSPIAGKLPPTVHCPFNICSTTELPNVQARFRKGKGTRDQIANIHWVIETGRKFQKPSTSASLTTLKTLTMWIKTNSGKFLKRCEYQTTLPGFWETCMQVKKQQLESNMEQQTGSKLGKEYIKAVYCRLAYLTFMQSISCEILGWMRHKLESRLPGEISRTTDMQMIHL